MWDKWVDASSSNVEFALKSRVPTLVGKVATLCSSTKARVINLRSVVMGFGYKGYKWKWWWRPLVNPHEVWVSGLCKPTNEQEVVLTRGKHEVA